MIRIYVICEGQTESAFTRDVLAPHLSEYGLQAIAKLIGKPGHRGGNVQFDRLRYDVEHYLKQDSAAYCTMLVDYYGLLPKFPGRGIAHLYQDSRNRYQAVTEALRSALRPYLGDRLHRFIPYIQMHEFEGLLFSDSHILASSLDQVGLENALLQIRRAHDTPEDINDSHETAPSKRLQKLMRSYNKVLNGPAAASAIGLPTLRAACPLFHGWVTQLETLSPG